MAIEVRLLREDEFPIANNFFNSIYNSSRSLEEFRWEFVDGPRGKAIYVVAIDQGAQNEVKVVGIQCAIPLELMDARGNYILTAKSEDTLVHPDYRGQKLFERMYDVLFSECSNAGIRYIWGFTPAVKAFQRIGFAIPFQASQALMVFEPLKSFAYLKKLNPANKAIDKFKILGLTFASAVRGLKRKRVGRNDLRLIEQPLSEKESFIKKFYADSRLHFIRLSDEYIRWRILTNPMGNLYRNFVLYDNMNKPVADFIVNFRPEVSYIEQMMFTPELDHKKKVQALAKVLAQIRHTGAPLTRVLCFAHNAELTSQVELLKDSGFIHLNRGNYFVWKSLDSIDRLDPKELFVTRLFTQGNS